MTDIQIELNGDVYIYNFADEEELAEYFADMMQSNTNGKVTIFDDDGD